MMAFRCRVCDNPLHFENSLCVACGSALGFSRAERAIVPVDETGQYVDATGLVWHVCANLNLSGCTWLAPLQHGQCSGCDLTRTRPSDDDVVGLENYPAAEAAKRHLLVELDGLGLVVRTKDEDPVDGLAFDLLSSVEENVVIGHQDGVITIDLAESDDAHREKVRSQLAEPYRTMLGHFRHEFGHYAEGPPEDWADSYISTYATMHPFEDFAETWSHYLHICDSIETARAYGLAAVGSVADFSSFRDVVTGVWVPLSIALNQMNRSMGKDDVYPFVIPAPVLDKLEFVASLVPLTGAPPQDATLVG